LRKEKCDREEITNFSISSEAALKRISGQQQLQSHGHQDNFAKVQGSMSEDEALAKAIYESMVAQQITAGDGPTSSTANGNDRNKNCAIS
jgi:hypothetical protein